MASPERLSCVASLPASYFSSSLWVSSVLVPNRNACFRVMGIKVDCFVVIPSTNCFQYLYYCKIQLLFSSFPSSSAAIFLDSSSCSFFSRSAFSRRPFRMRSRSSSTKPRCFFRKLYQHSATPTKQERRESKDFATLSPSLFCFSSCLFSSSLPIH